MAKRAVLFQICKTAFFALCDGFFIKYDLQVIDQIEV